MEPDVSELRRLLAEAQQREAESRQREAEARQLAAEARQREAETRRQLSEERIQTRDTTLPEFLDACHVHLFLGMNVQTCIDSSTKGDPANADNKLRPARIREWVEFPQEQTTIWDNLMCVDLVVQRHFTPRHTLERYGQDVQGMMGSELDLGYFERFTIELRVAEVIKKLYASPQLRRVFHLNGDVTFENHANTLTDESEIVADMGSLSLTQGQPRRSQRLAAKQSHTSQLQLTAQSVANDQNPMLRKPSRPRADQFCVYNKGPEERVPAFIVEYKAPHKLTLAHIKAGLSDIELDDVLCYQEVEKPEDTCRRVVAAVITQAFSYMIKAGLEYGYVCTGEAFIFLRVPHDDPSTVYYYLSLPKEDVGDTTGWTGNTGDDNRLHLTALGQVLAFTLRALQTPPRSIQWRNSAAKNLDTWVMVYADLWEEAEKVKDVPCSDSDFMSPKSRNKYCRMSPVKTRSMPTALFESCVPLEVPSSSGFDDSSDEFDSNTPSRRPRDSRFAGSSPLPPSSTTVISRGGSSSQGKSRQYCTQQCLLGLVTRGRLDEKCPNVRDHGVGRHSISQVTLISLLHRQLSMHDPRPDLEIGCDSLHIHGSRGALHKVTLLSHGYTFVGKGVPVEFVKYAQHEESVYSRLRPIQGVHVPVVLGGLPLRQPFSYDGIADIVHLTLMGYAGKTLAKPHDVEPDWLIKEAEVSLHAIHALGVLHNDPIAGNMVWNKDSGRVMFIDFERAQLQKIPRPPLESLSPNQKRKQATDAWEKAPNKRSTRFECEIRTLRHVGIWRKAH
ncbi:hypothetical protein DTO006G1_1951 [Penicillium roqueforti]|uniref:Protein kinase-like domain n=1 Tax=Penicillium roqueforti (strain FM164) TaxID=1365484 RepID=W6QSA4_PENRF|nr:uncharacterized protein LCP9604111_7568 [Penicillium roqueforti]CDM36994.1 Protein kinase-like domain [Penicillium roqueforti FM164]KAF9243649.1 hypothetical protein LCP9604111_7568 [Penicillium roqueforti]KAI1832355.1 hypothetical protein CBS147337_7035 [Penicillium roqueforti]KAI2679394.1 hypothetical protein CBS147355_3876 [Penicillium roqueforti]KAI2713016.1 hypothetical protein CBS147354_7827 [Penicillium roqueforti]